MSAHLSRLRLFQRHLRSLVWVWVWVWDWIHSHTPPRTRSPSSRHPPFTHYPFPLRSLVCGGQPSPHKPRLVVSHSTCPPLSSSPHANSFVLGTAVINTHTHTSILVLACCACRVVLTNLVEWLRRKGLFSLSLSPPPPRSRSPLSHRSCNPYRAVQLCRIN
jgi:hypothetical protein